MGLALLVTSAMAQQKAEVAGVYPHLTMYNKEGECGTGAVVPWGGEAMGDHLWASQTAWVI